MSYGPNPYTTPGLFNGVFEPESFNTLRLPVPETSPQFQQGQLQPGPAMAQAIGPNEVRQMGPQTVNAIPGYPNVSNPDLSYSGGQGAGFGNTPLSPGIIPQAPAAPVQTPIDSQPYAPRSYADAGTYSPEYTGATQAPQAPASPGPGLADFGKRLQQAAAWIAPPANAQAALGFRNADSSEAQQVVSNQRADKELEIKKAAQAATLRQMMAKNTSIETSANGKFRVITTKNPMTGEVSISRQPIPEDEQDASSAAGKDPSAMLNRDITSNNSIIARNAETLGETDKVLHDLETGQVNFSAMRQGVGAVKNYLNMSDPNAQKVAGAQRILQNLVEDRLNMEKGGGSNEKLKQVMAQVIPQGSGYYDNAQWEQAIRLQRKLLADRTAATLDGNAQAMRANTRLSADVDPQTGRPTHETYTARAQAIRFDQGAKDEAWRRRDAGAVEAPSAPAAPRVSSPLLEGLNRRFGTPGQ